MLAYAAHRRRLAGRDSAPSAMLFIIAAHLTVIAAVMSTKLDLPGRIERTITETYNVPLPKDPPPPPPPQRARPEPRESVIEQPSVIVPLPQPPLAEPLDSRPVAVPTPGELIGPGADPGPRLDPQPRPAPVRTGPRFVTPDHLLRPPYPPSKIDSGEEALLRLRLAIDAGGRVTAVEPVGRADPAFLAAARRHLLARWRYKPATEDGRAIASSTVITLRFELE